MAKARKRTSISVDELQRLRALEVGILEGGPERQREIERLRTLTKVQLEENGRLEAQKETLGNMVTDLQEDKRKLRELRQRYSDLLNIFFKLKKQYGLLCINQSADKIALEALDREIQDLSANLRSQTERAGDEERIGYMHKDTYALLLHLACSLLVFIQITGGGAITEKWLRNKLSSVNKIGLELLSDFEALVDIVLGDIHKEFYFDIE